MGTFSVRVELGDPQGQRYEPLEAHVDTGATYTVVPASVLRRQGVSPYATAPFVLAGGRQVELEIGQTWVRVDGRTVITLVVFGEEEVEPLLGAYTLEEVRLAPDPVGQRLMPVPGRLMTALAPRRLNHGLPNGDPYARV